MNSSNRVESGHRNQLFGVFHRSMSDLSPITPWRVIALLFNTGLLAVGIALAARSLIEVSLVSFLFDSVAIFIVSWIAMACLFWIMRPTWPVHLMTWVLAVCLILIPTFVPYYARESVRHELGR